MSDTYEINEFGQVVPYTGGRRCNDTRAWRDATELEEQQAEEIRNLQLEIHCLQQSAEMDAMTIEGLRKTVMRYRDQKNTGPSLQLANSMRVARGDSPCPECDGRGWNESDTSDGRSDGNTYKEMCELCDGVGFDLPNSQADQP